MTVSGFYLNTVSDYLRAMGMTKRRDIVKRSIEHTTGLGGPNLNETKGRGILWLLVVFVAHPFRFEGHGNLGQSCDILDSYAGNAAIVLNAF